MVGVPGEPYSLLQTELRRRLPGQHVLVMVMTNGSLTTGYILPCALCGAGMYQDQIAVLAPGALEGIVDAIVGHIAAWAGEAGQPGTEDSRM